jgi:7,8-dihydroneopterin aldolase/epimerase/oxygenase
MTAGPGHRPADRIEIRDLRVLGVHGVTAEERAQAQPIALDLDVAVRPGDAAASDALADTVDYGVLVALATAVVTDRSFALLEALGGAVADALLSYDDRVERVEVCVRKLRPPLPFDVGSVGVRIVRTR